MAEVVTFGITGPPAAGKGVISSHLKRIGCQHISGSDTIRRYAREHGLSLNGRPDFASTLVRMEKEDPMAMLNPYITAGHDNVFDGLRVPNHVKLLREHTSLVIIAAVCDSDEERFRRAMAAFDERGGRDKTTLEAFLADEYAENYSPDPNKSSVSTIVDMADYHVDTLALSPAEQREYVENIYALTV